MTWPKLLFMVCIVFLILGYLAGLIYYMYIFIDGKVKYKILIETLEDDDLQNLFVDYYSKVEEYKKKYEIDSKIPVGSLDPTFIIPYHDVYDRLERLIFGMFINIFNTIYVTYVPTAKNEGKLGAPILGE